MSVEFSLIAYLNTYYMKPDEYQMITAQDIPYDQDLHTPGFQIRPSANPNTSSKIQRIMQVSAELSQIPNIQQAGGNIRPILEHYLNTIDSESTDLVFPEQTPEQQLEELIARFPEQLQPIVQQMGAPAQAQTDFINKESERKDLELSAKLDQVDSEVKKRIAERAKLEAEAALKMASIPKVLAEAEREKELTDLDHIKMAYDAEKTKDALELQKSNKRKSTKKED